MPRYPATPMAEGTGPQNEGDVIRALIEQNHARLLRYVRRHLWHEVALDKISRNAIDPLAVVDEITCQALAAPEKKRTVWAICSGSISTWEKLFSPGKVCSKVCSKICKCVVSAL